MHRTAASGREGEGGDSARCPRSASPRCRGAGGKGLITRSRGTSWKTRYSSSQPQQFLRFEECACGGSIELSVPGVLAGCEGMWDIGKVNGCGKPEGILLLGSVETMGKIIFIHQSI